MGKVKLCANDEHELISAMKNLAKILEDVGIEGAGVLTFSTNGDVNGTFSVNDSTSLLITVEDDGDKRTVEYKYV